MSVIHYLVRDDIRELFELGKYWGSGFPSRCPPAPVVAAMFREEYDFLTEEEVERAAARVVAWAGDAELRRISDVEPEWDAVTWDAPPPGRYRTAGQAVDYTQPLRPPPEPMPDDWTCAEYGALHRFPLGAKDGDGCMCGKMYLCANGTMMRFNVYDLL